MSLASSSLLNTHTFLNPNLNPNPRFPKAIKFSIKSNRNSPPPPPPTTTTTEKKSLAVATGELFLGLASRLIRTRSKEEEEGEAIAAAAAAAAECPVDDEDVIWEQREKDVEAEKERKKVMSPGFNFSAAGLLFPYHLGVAQFLIENRYIKSVLHGSGVHTVGWLICWCHSMCSVASGSSMQDALQFTKVLANDCRLKGTAFRLGACSVERCSYRISTG